jgi:integrase
MHSLQKKTLFASLTSATFLQVSKDTAARSAEAAKLKWIDIDEKTCTTRINNPIKGSNARIVKVHQPP